MTRRSEVGIDLVARDMASREIGAVGGSIRDLGGAAQSTGGHFGALGGIVRGVSQGVFLGVGMMAAQQLSRAVSSIPGSIIGMNADLEKSQLQFETLFGGGADAADRAREHVRMLFDFAKETPFETQPVINASRILQTFGGDALNTSKNLRMIGDAAAGASADIGDVSFWVGRAYAAIQGGQPFGEARMRLQELALLSPKAADEMERLQKAGASSAEVWAVMEKELGRFNGAMGKQAQTWSGLTSTLSDTVKLTMADAFKPFFDMAKEGLKALITLFSNPAFSTGLKAFATGLASVLTGFVQGIVAISGPVMDFFTRLASAFGDIVNSAPVVAILSTVSDTLGKIGAIIGDVFSGDIGLAFDDLAEGFGISKSALEPLMGLFDSFSGVIKVLGDNMSTIAGIVVGTFLGPWSSLVGVFRAVQSGASDVGGAFASMQQGIISNLATLVTNLVPALADLAGKFADWVLSALPGLLANLGSYLTTMLGWLLDHLPDIVNQLLAWGGAFVEWLAPRIPQIVGELLKFVGRMVAWMIYEGIPRLLVAVARIGGALISGFMDWLGKLPGRIADFIATVVIPGLGSFASGFLSKAKEIAGSFLKGFIDGLVSLPGRLMDTIANAFRSIKIDIGPFHISASGIRIDLPNIKLPSFAVGAWSLPSDMVAMVHKDEMIIPADIARRLRGESGGGTAPVVSSGAASGGGATIIQNFNFGRDSIRSDDDVRRLAVEINNRAQLQGFAATVRQVGRVAS